MEQVVSSIPGSVGYISHVQRAYNYLGPFGVLWVHMARHKQCVRKIIGSDSNVYYLSKVNKNVY